MYTIIDYLNYKTHSDFVLIDEYKKLIAYILKNIQLMILKQL